MRPQINPQKQCQFEAEDVGGGALRRLGVSDTYMEQSEVQIGQEAKKPNLMLTVKFVMVIRY